MTYKQIKWMILLIPTLTVGIWEYVRHQFLLPYISMTAGNWLTPVIVYLVSITLLNKLFRIMERIQQELESERAATAALEARGRLANELHDGIAQSLFLLSVKVDKLEGQAGEQERQRNMDQIRKIVHEVNRYVRQAIKDLKYEPVVPNAGFMQETMHFKLNKMVQEIPLEIAVAWSIPETALLAKEKVELLACIREAVVNMEKHSGGTQGWITGEGDGRCWKVTVKDNGKGFAVPSESYKDRYGLRIMKERAEAMNWRMELRREHGYTVVEWTKEDGRT